LRITRAILTKFCHKSNTLISKIVLVLSHLFLPTYDIRYDP
jgi:hypothetical protein